MVHAFYVWVKGFPAKPQCWSTAPDDTMAMSPSSSYSYSYRHLYLLVNSLAPAPWRSRTPELRKASVGLNAPGGLDGPPLMNIRITPYPMGILHATRASVRNRVPS